MSLSSFVVVASSVADQFSFLFLPTFRLNYPPEAINSYVNYPPHELQIIADQLQDALRRSNIDRRPVAEGDEPSPKRTRVEGPPRVSMQQQQQQALRQMHGGQQGGRIPSGQVRRFSFSTRLDFRLELTFSLFFFR